MAQRDGLTDWHLAAEAAGKPWPEELAVERLQARRLGVVVGGSLSEGLRVRLDRQSLIEDVAVGRYVVVEGRSRRFFGMITDVALDVANPALEKNPPDLSDPFLREIHEGTSIYGRLEVTPLLVLVEGEREPRPVKTVPAHYSVVANATPEEVNRVFGQADERHFHVGSPIEMPDVKVHLNLARLMERSSGVFGKSGTGKSFLTRILLAGAIKQQVAVSLIFDMHNDYGWEIRDKATGRRVKGLRQLCGSRVEIFTLDPESSLRRKSPYNAAITIGYHEVEPEDLEMLRETKNLSDLMIGAAYTLAKRLGRNWIARLLVASGMFGTSGYDEEAAQIIDELRERGNIAAGTLEGLVRRLADLARYPFLVEDVGESAVQKIFDYLRRGISVVLEFGRYGNSLEAYLFVANFLTRRLHQRYVEAVESALGDAAQEPPHLVIVVEEAHKFLAPQIARQTIFGTIARELRKYNVTLLIVDQRPSGIDPEVMSQIGTRITCLLDNEEDIRAVFTGISGAGELRQVLARLDNREQALILGYAVPMPVVVQTRKYDETFYEEMGVLEGEALQAKAAQHSRLLHPDADSEGLD
jgi:DNA helicase HerA-like ATPase